MKMFAYGVTHFIGYNEYFQRLTGHQKNSIRDMQVGLFRARKQMRYNMIPISKFNLGCTLIYSQINKIQAHNILHNIHLPFIFKPFNPFYEHFDILYTLAGDVNSSALSYIFFPVDIGLTNGLKRYKDNFFNVEYDTIQQFYIKSSYYHIIQFKYMVNAVKIGYVCGVGYNVLDVVEPEFDYNDNGTMLGWYCVGESNGVIKSVRRYKLIWHKYEKGYKKEMDFIRENSVKIILNRIRRKKVIYNPFCYIWGNNNKQNRALRTLNYVRKFI